MELKKYRLQTEMEILKQGNEEWFKDYVRGVLESNKPYFEKADYIAYSINQITNKIEYINNEIKELFPLSSILQTFSLLNTSSCSSIKPFLSLSYKDNSNIRNSVFKCIST